MTHTPYNDHQHTHFSEFGEVASPTDTIFLVDMDGVLVNLTDRVHDQFEQLRPDLHLTPTAAYTEFYWELNHSEDCHDTLAQVVTEPGFFLTPDPMPGAIEGIQALAKMGPTFICTAPMFSNPTCMQDKVEWVRRWLGKEWIDRMIITKDKTTVRGDILFDDRPQIDGRLVPQWQHVLYGHVYNRHLEGQKARYSSWVDFVEAMKCRI